jgi:TPR repeat protein
VAKNNAQAFKWMLESASMDYVRAQNNIGLYYKNGTGCTVDLELAVEWLEKAESANYHKLAKKTLQEARDLLARARGLKTPGKVDSSPHHAYAMGLEMFGKRKYKQAFEYWLDAAEKGYPKAACDVGWMFSQGHGVTKDNKKAFEFMLQAADKGYHRAQNNIGLYYKNGTGCDINMGKAVEWLEKAEAANYDKLAKKALKEAKRILEQETLTAAAGGAGDFVPMQPLGAAPAGSEGNVSGPESSMEKYKSALRMGLANGKSVSHGEGKVLADLRRELDITDALHEQCLRQLGFTLAEFDNMSAPSDEVVPAKNECVVCMDAVADHCILFCMHVCLCHECADNYRDAEGKGKGTCPKCRSEVKMVKKIF